MPFSFVCYRSCDLGVAEAPSASHLAVAFGSCSDWSNLYIRSVVLNLGLLRCFWTATPRSLHPQLCCLGFLGVAVQKHLSNPRLRTTVLSCCMPCLSEFYINQAPLQSHNCHKSVIRNDKIQEFFYSHDFCVLNVQYLISFQCGSGMINIASIYLSVDCISILAWIYRTWVLRKQ